MHFELPRTITTSQNRNFLKILVFQGFLYTRLGHFGLIFSLKVSKHLQKMAKQCWKNEKHLIISQKYSKHPQNTFWASWNHHNLPKPNFSQNLSFSGFPILAIHQIRSFLAHFTSNNFKIIAKIAKEWWKNEINLEIFQKYSKLPQNAFWAS